MIRKLLRQSTLKQPGKDMKELLARTELQRKKILVDTYLQTAALKVIDVNVVSRQELQIPKIPLLLADKIKIDEFTLLSASLGNQGKLERNSKVCKEVQNDEKCS